MRVALRTVRMNRLGVDMHRGSESVDSMRDELAEGGRMLLSYATSPELHECETPTVGTPIGKNCSICDRVGDVKHAAMAVDEKL